MGLQFRKENYHVDSYFKCRRLRGTRQHPKKRVQQDADQFWKAKRNQKLAGENQKNAYSDSLNDSSPVYINDAVDTYFLANYLSGDSGCDSSGDSTGGFGGFGDFGGW